MIRFIAAPPTCLQLHFHPLDDRQVSLKEAAAELPDDHGEFEGRFRDGFNEAYYEQLCSASGACLGRK